jgi:sucrose phosphorylase
MENTGRDNSAEDTSPKNRSGFKRIFYNPKPDYTLPLLEIPPEAKERLLSRMIFLYGEALAWEWLPDLERIMKVHYAHKPQELIDQEKDFNREERFTEKDLIMITYGDLLSGQKHSPLASLGYFLERPRLKEVINTIHILPFFPYSSDRGFSITDFKRVDPQLGTWEDIAEIGKEYKLLFDGVLNHASSESEGFQEFLNGNPRFQDIVISYASRDELSPEQRRLIRRPRTSDLLTKYHSLKGPVYVWTTFSPDQIDLNFRSPRILIYIIDVLLLYVRHGADIIRLDAVTYLWQELGTECASLAQTHEIIKLFRDVLNVIAPSVAVLTETNVPHAENVSYFGNGHDEAQMVYNFALPPLVLHTFYTGNTTALSEWAGKLKYPSKTTTFFNMLDTHDGVGLPGVKNILSREEIDFMIEKAKKHKAFVSYKTGADGKNEPYEINTTWFGALNDEDSDEDLAFQVKRFVASRSISFVLRGVPGVYFHGMIGTGNDPEIVKESGHNRDINRKTVDERALNMAIEDPESKMSLIRRYLKNIVEHRVGQRVFHPNGEQKVLMISPEVFSVLRISPEGDERIMTFTNVTDWTCTVEVSLSELGTDETKWYDLINDTEYSAENQKLVLTMEPYDVVWLKPEEGE